MSTRQEPFNEMNGEKDSAPIEELLFLFHRNEIAVSIPDTAIIRDGILRGLFYNANPHSDSPLVFDSGWPVVDYDTHQTRMYSTKRASEAAAKIDVAANFFSKDSVDPEVVPVVIHISAKPQASGHGSTKVDVSCQFFTKSRFTELLRSMKLPNGVVCRYTPPANRHHHLIRVVFTPFAVLNEQHEACEVLDNSAVPLVERVSVSPGNPGAFRNVTPSEEMKSYSRSFCSRIFEYFRSQGAAMDRAIFFFIQPCEGRHLFMWPGSIELKPWYLDSSFSCFDASCAASNGISNVPAPTPVATGTSQASNNPGMASVAAAEVSPTAAMSQQAPIMTSAGRLLCPSPVAPALQHENHVQLFGDVKDFGFYSDEPQRVKDSLKRQIRSICRVENPSSMVVDDTPPYDDDFILALCHPERAEAYFFPSGPGGNWRNRRGTQLCRSKSKIFRFINTTDEESIDDRTMKFERSIGSFRRIRSGSIALGSDTLSPTSHMTRQVSDGSMIARSSSAVMDPELSRILVDHADELQGVGAMNSIIATAIPKENREAVEMISRLRPDWKHSGHIARIRRKYGANAFSDDEDEAEMRRIARLRVASTKATAKVEKRLQSEKRSSISVDSQPNATSSSALRTTFHQSSKNSASSRRASSANTFTKASQYLADGFMTTLRMSKPGDPREEKWVDVLSRDHDYKAPFVRLARAPPSATQALLSKVIPKYETKLAEGSLLGYLVDTEVFEREPKAQPLDIPLEDCRCERRKVTRILSSDASNNIPDVPVVELTNLHLSLSEEIIRNRHSSVSARQNSPERSANRHSFQLHGSSERKKRISMMEMLFGRYRDELQSSKRTAADTTPRRHTSVGVSGVDSNSDDDSDVVDDSDFSHAQQAYAEQLHRSAEKDEKKLRQMNLQRYGISDSKEKVQIIVGTFEDLVYQWTSDPGNDFKKATKTFAPKADMRLHVPPAFFHLRKELRSLMVSIGFREDSVEAITIPAYQQAITDELLDEVPQYVKIFTMQVTPVTVSRVLSAAKMFAADVVGLYSDCRWEVIEKIREMTEIQGFTFVDAVLMVTPGNLMERSCVSHYVPTFADIKV